MAQPPIRSKVAAHLREARTRAGLSRRALSNLSGVNERSITNYETGINEPPLTQALKLAQALGVSLDDLVAGVTSSRVAPGARTPEELIVESISLQQEALRMLSD